MLIIVLFLLSRMGKKALYLDFVVLGQIIPVANVNPEINLDIYDFKENVVLIYCPVYNKSAGLYSGLTKKLGHITLRGDAKERFFSYGFNKEKSSLFYCSMKTPLPNIFNSAAFKKHLPLYLMKIKKGTVFKYAPFLTFNP